VSGSPIERLLEAIDRRDVEAAMAPMATDCRLLTVDGRRAEGAEAMRALFADILETLHSSTHRITAQWHLDEVWIAETEADYELKDWMRLTALPRAFVLRYGAEGVTDVRVYGAHERPLIDHGAREEGIRLGGRWMPAL
jgi:hypothetical protein